MGYEINKNIAMPLVALPVWKIVSVLPTLVCPAFDL
jgi:hypothetical protein